MQQNKLKAMIQHDRILLVPVPVGAFGVEYLEDTNKLVYSRKGCKGVEFTSLPDGFKLTIHGISTTLSEGVCKGIAEKAAIGFSGVKYTNHLFNRTMMPNELANPLFFDSATNSIRSLILHYGYDPERCVVVGIS